VLGTNNFQKKKKKEEKKTNTKCAKKKKKTLLKRERRYLKNKNKREMREKVIQNANEPMDHAS